MRFLRNFGTRISHTVVLPQLVLTLAVAVVITVVTVYLTARTLQHNLDDRLVATGQATSSGLVVVEDRQAERLRTVVFTQGIARAVDEQDTASLEELLYPFWTNARLDALVVFDVQGQPMIQWQRAGDATTDAPPQPLSVPDFSSWWLVQQTTNGSNTISDPFSAFHGAYFWTAAPVTKDSDLVGGIMVGLPVDAILQQLQSVSRAAVTTIYDGDGRAVATTQEITADTVVPAVPTDALVALRAGRDGGEPLRVQSVASLDDGDYQFAYSPLRVRRTMNSFFAVGLSRTALLSTWTTEYVVLVLGVLTLAFATTGVGVWTARRIAAPISDVIATARAVLAGDLQQRSTVTGRDELADLADSVNQMTRRLVQLYDASRHLGASTHVATVLEQASIAAQPLVPDATAVALLRDDWGWYVATSSEHATPSDVQVRIADDVVVLALAKHADSPIVTLSDARRLRTLALPSEYHEVCYVALKAHGALLGVLFWLHREQGAFSAAILQPLGVIAQMTATALHNAQHLARTQTVGAQHQRVLDGIADAVIVCGADHQVVFLNQAAQNLLQIHDWQQRSYPFNQLPLKQIPSDLHYSNGDQTVRYAMDGHTLEATRTSLADASGAHGEMVVLRTVPLAPAQPVADDGAAIMAQLLARIEHNNLVLDLQPTSIEAVAEQALQPLRSIAALGAVPLIVDLADDLPLVQIDPAATTLVMQQLLNHAITHSRNTPVRLLARRHQAGVLVIVHSFAASLNGAQYLNGTTRANGSAVNNGLSVARNLAEGQGGTVTVRSQPDRGTLVTILLPGATYASRAVAA